MAISTAIGTTFQWNGVAIAELTAINGVEVTAGTIDITTHDVTDNYTREIPSLITAGDVTLEGFLDNADTTGQQAMLVDLNSKTLRTGIITFPAITGCTWTFSGYAIAVKIGDAPVDGMIPFTATVKIYGKPIFAIATVTGMSAIGFSNDVLIMPVFAIGLYEYVVTITAGQTSTVITPVDATSGEVITITTDGGSSQIVATGEASSACTLDVDDVTEIVITISHATKASKTYTFHCAVLAA